MLLNNVMQRLLAHNVAKRNAQIGCNALCTGLDDTCAAASDAYAAGNRKKLPVWLCLASVCWLAKPRGCIKVTRDVSQASPDPFARVYGV